MTWKALCQIFYRYLLNSYIHIDKKFNQNPDYPKILLDIDYQLCTLDVCKNIRDGIEGLDCQKALQNPPKW